jgi:hypothetical protein
MCHYSNDHEGRMSSCQVSGENKNFGSDGVLRTEDAVELHMFVSVRLNVMKRIAYHFVVVEARSVPSMPVVISNHEPALCDPEASRMAVVKWAVTNMKDYHYYNYEARSSGSSYLRILRLETSLDQDAGGARIVLLFELRPYPRRIFVIRHHAASISSATSGFVKIMALPI